MEITELAAYAYENLAPSAIVTSLVGLTEQPPTDQNPNEIAQTFGQVCESITDVCIELNLDGSGTYQMEF